MATSYELILDRDYVGIEQRIARPRPAARVIVPVEAVSLRVNPIAGVLKVVRSAFLGSVTLMVIAFVATLLLDGGWQAVAAAVAINAGMGALIASLVAVTLADGIPSR
ncbi:MAG: hypothetical protein QOI45_2480 [Thermoleophilaceae bacterium]|jgi:hypothetical protein|nr:hypothetical protein [Thermoleophilaceae bacterium]MEA2456218.1 hypothetical protein [Thermoleophilaceae bacterium]